MSSVTQYLFSQGNPNFGTAGLLPLLPLELDFQSQSVSTVGLLDTGATVNVLPFKVGQQLGAIWEPKLATIQLGGNLAQYAALPLIIFAKVAQFAPVRLAFAWTQAEDVPVILGQVNFFLEFDVCFYRSRQIFEIQPKK
ncbi:MAG: hypothetical protein HY774_03370 [Acidobacteria bacterium]|nr:hypothetical protein [Acidobacteriota bacterium]